MAKGMGYDGVTLFFLWGFAVVCVRVVFRNGFGSGVIGYCYWILYFSDVRLVLVDGGSFPFPL